MTQKNIKPEKYYYELRLIPKTWFGKLLAGLIIIVILWLAIMFITLFLVVVGLTIALLVLYSSLRFNKNKTGSGAASNKDSNSVTEPRQNGTRQKKEKNN